MQTISKQDWQAIPEQAQQEVYDFFLFIKQRYGSVASEDNNETIAFSNHSANLIDEWKNDDEDSVLRECS